MKTTATTIAVAVTLALVAGGATAIQPGSLIANTLETQDVTVQTAQEGTNAGCLDYLVLWALDGIHSPLGDSERLDASAGASYTAASDDGIVFLDFYDAGGAYITSGGETGTVPGGTAYAYGCVTVGGTWPDAPVPGATFTYAE